MEGLLGLSFLSRSGSTSHSILFSFFSLGLQNLLGVILFLHVLPPILVILQVALCFFFFLIDERLLDVFFDDL